MLKQAEITLRFAYDAGVNRLGEADLYEKAEMLLSLLTFGLDTLIDPEVEIETSDYVSWEEDEDGI